MMPSARAWKKPNPALLFAVESATAPTAPAPNLYCPLANTRPTVITDPTKFPTQTTSQFHNMRVVLTLRLAQAMTMRLLPVNSSAPATMTRIRPRLKASPAKSLTTP